jgi:hypothetical protein
MPIVRFQIDTAMTLFGRRLVININDYVTHMMQGLERRKHRDRDGEPMTDAYLHRKLTGEYEYTSELYSYSSGFIHFSTHHLTTCIGSWTSISGEVPASWGYVDTTRFWPDGLTKKDVGRLLASCLPAK